MGFCVFLQEETEENVELTVARYRRLCCRWSSVQCVLEYVSVCAVRAGYKFTLPPTISDNRNISRSPQFYRIQSSKCVIRASCNQIFCPRRSSSGRHALCRVYVGTCCQKDTAVSRSCVQIAMSQLILGSGKSVKRVKAF